MLTECSPHKTQQESFIKELRVIDCRVVLINEMNDTKNAALFVRLDFAESLVNYFSNLSVWIGSIDIVQH